jgi:hypothetical protein
MWGYHYTSWFVIYILATYDTILGKNWMEEASHLVNLQWNIIWLGQSVSGSRCKQRLRSLPQNEGGWKYEGMTMAVLAKPVHTVSGDTANIEDLDGDLAAMVAR